MAELGYDGKVAIITGSGGGLGREHALLLASRGAQVVVNDLGGSVSGDGGDAGPAERTAKEINGLGGVAVADTNSVSTPEGGEAIVATALDSFGRVDIVVNNAGILRDKTFAKLEWPDLDAVLDVHLKGAFYVSQPAFKVMKENGYGRFVFTASNAGVFGNFGQTNYGAAKMGLVGLSNVLAVEGARAGINSNVIMPVALTRMTEQILGPMADQLDPSLVTPMVTYLSSENCTFSHEVFSATAGRYARVFVGLAPGWYAGKGAKPTAEDISEHIEEIEKQDGYIVPMSVADELTKLAEILQQ